MIFFLYGENTFLAKRKLKELKEKFLNDVDPGGNNLFYLDGINLDINKLNEKVGSRSLLVKKRMVIIEDIFLNKTLTIFKDLSDFLKSKEEKLDDTIIIFIDSSLKTKQVRTSKDKQILQIDKSGNEKKLLKNPLALFNYLDNQKFKQEFPAFSNTEAANWIKNEVEKNKALISYQAANLTVSLSGNDLWKIDNEIKKLINYKAGLEPKLLEGGKKINIDIKDVETLVRGNFDENIFALTDAISARNAKLALKQLEEQYEAGLNDSYIISMFLRQFKILLQIRESLDSGLNQRKIMSTLKLHPFVIQKGINQVRNFNVKKLKEIFSDIVAIDEKIKTGKGDAKTMLGLLIAKI